ncbi:MAG: hypothetical protein KDK66_05395 [Deltaproteobacteria bacterium]|nr:hypothetical protein [Deltaproteobacteria bacterium]
MTDKKLSVSKGHDFEGLVDQADRLIKEGRTQWEEGGASSVIGWGVEKAVEDLKAKAERIHNFLSPVAEEVGVYLDQADHYLPNLQANQLDLSVGLGSEINLFAEDSWKSWDIVPYAPYANFASVSTGEQGSTQRLKSPSPEAKDEEGFNWKWAVGGVAVGTLIAGGLSLLGAGGTGFVTSLLTWTAAGGTAAEAGSALVRVVATAGETALAKAATTSLARQAAWQGLRNALAPYVRSVLGGVGLAGVTTALATIAESSGLPSPIPTAEGPEGPDGPDDVDDTDGETDTDGDDEDRRREELLNFLETSCHLSPIEVDKFRDGTRDLGNTRIGKLFLSLPLEDEFGMDPFDAELAKLKNELDGLVEGAIDSVRSVLKAQENIERYVFGSSSLGFSSSIGSNQEEEIRKELGGFLLSLSNLGEFNTDLYPLFYEEAAIDAMSLLFNTLLETDFFEAQDLSDEDKFRFGQAMIAYYEEEGTNLNLDYRLGPQQYIRQFLGIETEDGEPSLFDQNIVGPPEDSALFNPPRSGRYQSAAHAFVNTLALASMAQREGAAFIPFSLDMDDGNLQYLQSQFAHSLLSPYFTGDHDKPFEFLLYPPFLNELSSILEGLEDGTTLFLDTTEDTNLIHLDGETFWSTLEIREACRHYMVVEFLARLQSTPINEDGFDERPGAAYWQYWKELMIEDGVAFGSGLDEAEIDIFIDHMSRLLSQEMTYLEILDLVHDTWEDTLLGMTAQYIAEGKISEEVRMEFAASLFMATVIDPSFPNLSPQEMSELIQEKAEEVHRDGFRM